MRFRLPVVGAARVPVANQIGHVLVDPTGTVDLPADIALGATSALIDLPVTAPPQAGYYTLRLDLVHYFDGDLRRALRGRCEWC